MSRTAAAGDQGATSVEYALMLSLIFLVIVAAVGLLGASLLFHFTNAALI